ncbi:UNVERIFIED_CONTAM: hypothetical protein Sradi_1287600 [Sesamum radiatum]|uniref:Uncharacterized protein n=1 Tax=Sesamum radiatum TaxID=300843 RepID=A0AAW2URU3_SESRA
MTALGARSSRKDAVFLSVKWSCSSQECGVFRRRMRFSGKSMDKVLKEAFRRDDGKVFNPKGHV